MIGCLQKLMDDRVILQRRRDSFKKLMQHLTMKYEGLKTQLNENETFTQVRQFFHQCVVIQNGTCTQVAQFFYQPVKVGGSFNKNKVSI